MRILNNNQRLEIIKTVDNSATIDDNIISFHIDFEKIKYNIESKKFYVSNNLFGKVPHVMKDGQICMYGNIDLHLNEINEQYSLSNLVSKYIPWLLRLPLELKILEFLFEIEFYIVAYLGYNYELKSLKDEKVFKKIRLDTAEQIWETIENMENFLKYEVYVSGYEDYSIYLKKIYNKILIERDPYKKARQRITGKKCNNLSGKTLFIGVGSVNSYIIKYCLAHGINDIVLVDHDKFTIDNAFRFAFPYKGRKKIYAVKEFCKNLDGVKLELHNLNIKSKSNSNILNACERIIVSVDNLMAWIDIVCFLKENCSNEIEIVLAAINNFGENAKYVITSSNKIIDIMIDFLFNSKVIERRELIGNGCGKSIAIYDEELLVKLAKTLVKDIQENEKKDQIVYVDV